MVTRSQNSTSIAMSHQRRFQGMAESEHYQPTTPVYRLSPAPSPLPPASPGFAAAVDFVRARPWFSLIVLLPSALAVLYFGLIASDVYVSEARYVVRAVDNPRPGFLGNMLQSTGLAVTHDEAYSVRDFVLSRDIVRRLDAQHDLRGVLSRPEGDFVTRFPPLLGGHSFEQLYKTYGDFVTVTVDETTGISTLRVRGFRPADSYAVSRAILGYSEDLINRLNARARHDAIAVAEEEVRRSEARVAQAQAALEQYRLANRTLDPERQSAAVLDLAARLSGERATVQAQLSELTKASPDSPLIPSLKRRIVALDSQTATERGRIVNGTNGAVLTLSEYERLMLEREFAGKTLASALTSLETARLEAQRKQIYLDRIAEPNLPDYALYPRRLIAILETVLSVLLIYGIGWLVSASVREHVGR